MSDVVETWAVDGSWAFVTSSNVEAIRYHYDNQILEVEFRDGRYYQYYDVSVEVAKQMYVTKSPGTFVGQVLVNYSYTELPPLS